MINEVIKLIIIKNFCKKSFYLFYMTINKKKQGGLAKLIL